MVFNEFEGKSILITGGSSGIGRALALKMEASGALVWVISVNREEFRDLPPAIHCLEADIREEEQVVSAVRLVREGAGRIDMLVNAAGVSLWKELTELDAAFWDLVFGVNVKGTFLVTREVARGMIDRGSGLIINVASMSGLKSGMPGASAYMASKWAIVGLSRNLHLELKKHGIRVGCICPGSTLTDIHKKANSPMQDEMMEPGDIADSIMFMLAAPEKGHVQLLAQPAFFEEWK